MEGSIGDERFDRAYGVSGASLLYCVCTVVRYFTPSEMHFRLVAHLNSWNLICEFSLKLIVESNFGGTVLKT